MKLLKKVLIILMLGSVSVLSLSCAAKSDSSVAENQIVTVQRGDLTIDITAVGNLAFSHQEELAFEVGGTVSEVLVEVGDSVEEGQVLAKLDASEWEDVLAALERQLTAAERQLTAAERQLETKKRSVSPKELALRQAQVNLQTAEYNLSAIEDVKEAQDAIDDAEYDLKIAQAMMNEAGLSGASSNELSFWQSQIIFAQAELAEAQKELVEILAGSSVKVTTDVAIEVATKKLQVEQAQRQIEDAQIAIEDAQLDAEDAQMDVEDVQMDVEDAQEALEDAQSLNPVIMVPFAGIITTINISTGDVAKEGRAALILADTTQFEAEILVNEMDIFNIRLGAPVSIQVEAIPGISFPARVTHISLTAIIQTGVVNYKVTVELESFESLTLELEPLAPSDQEEQPQVVPGSIDEALDEAVKEGRISQEQADVMKERFGQIAGGFSQEQMEQFIERFGQGRGGFFQGQTEQFREHSGEGAGLGQRPGGMMLETIQLREGLTVTVSIIIQERNDVLLVPNQAITRQGLVSFVQVVENGVIEQRSVRTGLSDWQYTEIIEGLSEGEEVVVPQGTTTTSPTSQQGQRGSGFGIPFLRGGGGEH